MTVKTIFMKQYFRPLLLVLSLFSQFSLYAQNVCISPEEKKLYDLIMTYRKSKKLKSISFSTKLTQVAQTHVRDLSENYSMSNSEVCNPHSWSTKGSWTPCCYTSDHKQAQCMWDKPKEIAGYESSGYEIAFYSSAGAMAADGLEGWKKSSGHNPLLINSGDWKNVEWKAIGVGIYKEYAVVWFGQLADTSSPGACK